MMLKLSLSTSVTIDTDDIDPALIREATEELGLYLDENEDEAKPQSDLSDDEWCDIVSALLANDIDSVCNLNDEITVGDFKIEPAHPASPREPA
jgi:hypothetical protein